jgi:tetratricopeptide (TPR) repeat protein
MMLSAIVVFTSMSRNGVVSLVVAAAIVGLMLFRRGSLSWRGWLLGAVPLGVLAGLLIFGFDEVYERLATLQHTQAYEGRWEMLAATLRAWRAFPIFGTGLGTHQIVFPMFDTAVTPVVAAHADNEYAQLLEEMGVAGAAFVGLFLAGIAVLTVRLAFLGRKWSSAVASGVIFALVAVAIHSATDFGQRVPAIFCLSAAMCGLVVATAGIEARERRLQRGEISQTRSISLRARRAFAATSLASLIILWGWAIRDAYAAYLGERCWALALALENRVRQDSPQATDQDYVDLIAASQCAFSSEPRNVDYGYWLNCYRWESLIRNANADAQPTALDPDALQLVARIADELAKVRRICPTFGPPYALEGQLRLHVLGDDDGEELIRKGARLAPYDPPTCLVAGELAARHGQMKEAEAYLTRAVALRPAYFRDASEIYLFVLERPDLARSLAGDDYTRLEGLAGICAASQNYADLAPELRAAAGASLRRHAATDDASPRELAILASIDVRQRQFASAIELYRRALNRDYRQLEWRLDLARALAETGQVDDAIHEVRICLRLRPRHPGAIRLMKELIDRVDHDQLKDG